MAFSMSGEGYSLPYNRFDAFEKALLEGKKCGDDCDCDDCKSDKKKDKKKSSGSKPDYLDFDKDGDKEEPMTDALGEGYQRNPEKGEKETKKYAPVRGEKTPMPPRGNKRREDFEKWYAKNVKEDVDLSIFSDSEIDSLVEMYSEEFEQLDEAEGSYGQTPKARKGYGDLANKRRATPASGFAKRGEKTDRVKSAERHLNRTGNPDAGNRGKKSTKPSSFNYGTRKGMTQKDRDYSRGEAEYGHTGYDPDFDGGPSAPGSKPKGKKLERQKKTGVSEEVDSLMSAYTSMYTEGSVEDQMKASQEHFKKRNARSPEEKASEEKAHAKARAKNYADNDKNRPDPYKARQGESD